MIVVISPGNGPPKCFLSRTACRPMRPGQDTMRRYLGGDGREPRHEVLTIRFGLQDALADLIGLDGGWRWHSGPTRCTRDTQSVPQLPLRRLCPVVWRWLSRRGSTGDRGTTPIP